jgi:hypothetical protein
MNFESEMSTKPVSDLVTLKSRLDILKEEMHQVKVEMKRLKLEKPVKTKAVRSVVSSKSKTKSKSIPDSSIPSLSETQRDELLSIVWTASGIYDWIKYYFKDNISYVSESIVERFLSKVNSTFDTPKCGYRTISGSLKPALKKWADSALLLPEETRDHTLVAIASMYVIIDHRILSLRSNIPSSPPSSPSSSIIESSIASSKIVTFSTDTTIMNLKKDLSKDLEPEDISSLSSSMATLTLKPPDSFPPDQVINTEEEIEEPDSENDEDDQLPSEEDDFMSSTFIEKFKGCEMDCLAFSGFTSTSKMNGRINMIIISYNGNRMATSVKNKWTYTESAEIPFAMIENPADES